LQLACIFSGQLHCEENIKETLDAVGLLEHKDVQIGLQTLDSQRRLSFAMALIRNPKCLILDDPTRGLDETQKMLLWKAIAEIKHQVAILMVTNDS